MKNKRLTLSVPPSGTQAVEVTRQRFSHGRTRPVIVVRTTLEPGTHRDKPAMTRKSPPPPPDSNAQSLSEAKKARSKGRGQKRAYALLKQKQERTHRVIKKQRASRKKRQDRSPPPPVARPSKTREENLKDKVIQLYQTLVSYKAPELRDQAKAKVLKDWLYDLQTTDWAQKDRVRYEFILEVINAAAAGRKPPDIQVPSGGYFRWPTTKVGELSGKGIDAPDQELGVLGAMGYRVGLRGLDPALRRSLLSGVYRERLQVNLPAGYLEEWGQPQTGGRLQKLANTLASLTRNMKRRERPSEEAIDQWQADLEFLRKSFYVGRYDFKWPGS